MREQRLIMKEVCPKPYKRSKVEAVPGPHISVLLYYLFLPFFLPLPTTHTLTQGNRWAGERMLVGRIDTWSIIKHEQPRKVGQRKDRALASARILQLPTDRRRWTSGTWGCFAGWVLLPRLWITVASCGELCFGTLSGSSCMSSRIEIHYIWDPSQRL